MSSCAVARAPCGWPRVLNLARVFSGRGCGHHSSALLSCLHVLEEENLERNSLALLPGCSRSGAGINEQQEEIERGREGGRGGEAQACEVINDKRASCCSRGRRGAGQGERKLTATCYPMFNEFVKERKASPLLKLGLNFVRARARAPLLRPALRTVASAPTAARMTFDGFRALLGREQLQIPPEGSVPSRHYLSACLPATQSQTRKWQRRLTSPRR